MEGKRGRGKRRAMLLDEIKTNKIYEMIKSKDLDSESWRNWMPLT